MKKTIENTIPDEIKIQKTIEKLSDLLNEIEDKIENVEVYMESQFEDHEEYDMSIAELSMVRWTISELIENVIGNLNSIK